MKIECPTCKTTHTEKAWNDNTKEIVNSLNDNNENILTIENRRFGALYRCPNNECEDEVITLHDKALYTFTEEIEETYFK